MYVHTSHRNMYTIYVLIFMGFLFFFCVTVNNVDACMCFHSNHLGAYLCMSTEQILKHGGKRTKYVFSCFSNFRHSVSSATPKRLTRGEDSSGLLR